jgi:hypothetical protein
MQACSLILFTAIERPAPSGYDRDAAIAHSWAPPGSRPKPKENQGAQPPAASKWEFISGSTVRPSRFPIQSTAAARSDRWVGVAGRFGHACLGRVDA